MTRYKVGDTGSQDTDLSYAEAADRIGEWYEDLDTWATGVGDAQKHQAVAEAIYGVPEPPDDGGLDDLQMYASRICRAVARAMGGRDFAGHGNYYVTAADRMGLDLSVAEDDED